VFDRVEGLINQLEANPDPVVRGLVRELVRELLDFHATGLGRMMELVHDRGDLPSAFAGDSSIEPLLLLHGLHPDGLDVRVGRALEKVRPYLFSHGGNVELVGIEEGRVLLRLEGSCTGCPSSAQTLKTSIEEAILAAAPDAEGIEVV
jgi:Fe-S cluster biogenesis protein NfuA